MSGSLCITNDERTNITLVTFVMCLRFNFAMEKFVDLKHIDVLIAPPAKTVSLTMRYLRKLQTAAARFVSLVRYSTRLSGSYVSWVYELGWAVRLWWNGGGIVLKMLSRPLIFPVQLKISSEDSCLTSFVKTLMAFRSWLVFMRLSTDSNLARGNV